MLVACACYHAEIEQNPPPAVLLSAFGEKAIEFDIFAVVPNVARGGTVKSDIYFEIFKRFAEAGIMMPAAGRNSVWVHSVEDTPSAPHSAESRKATRSDFVNKLRYRMRVGDIGPFLGAKMR